MHHKWSKPIICSSCNQRFNFHKQEWYKAALPSALSGFFVVFIVLFGKLLFNKDTHLFLLISGMALLFVTVMWAFYKIRNIKLVYPSQQ